MNVQSRPMGEESPYLCSNRNVPGKGNCVWMTLAMPYPISVTPST
jgi:hypothetical protein